MRFKSRTTESEFPVAASVTLPRRRFSYVPVAMGVILITIIIPCALTWFATWGNGPQFSHHSNAPIFSGSTTPNNWNMARLFSIEAFALILCAPGGLILGVVLYNYLWYRPVSEQADERPVIIKGMWIGALISFLNFTGLGAGAYLGGYPWAITRIVLLFIVTGGTCGAWIAWCAYRDHHPERKWFPRFSMLTLLLLAFAWGVLLLAFTPQEPVYQPVSMVPQSER